MLRCEPEDLDRALHGWLQRPAAGQFRDKETENATLHLAVNLQVRVPVHHLGLSLIIE